jgi:alkanesulfonate monooxygenase SsuD/methylene tetrahydromethanopterin reductase-like flavin-dependent oxidoreductase (luciferase family)
MRLGVLMGRIADPANPRWLAEQAGRIAGEGFQSLWIGQAIGRGFMMPDPFVALGVAATVTDEVELGAAVLQAPLYRPVDLAHRILSLQQLCGDRLIIGLGAGSTEADFLAFGEDYKRRFASFRQGLPILRQMLATGRRGAADLSPWPVVKGGPKLFLGSWGGGVEEAAKDFDGWIASATFRSVAEIEAAAERHRAAGGGRSVVSSIMVTDETDLGELRERLGRFSAAGFDDAVVMITRGGSALSDVRRLVG